MRRIIKTDKAPAPVGPYNQAIAFNGTLYVSGQIAINPALSTSERTVLITDNIENETHQVMQNIKAVLTEAGVTFNDVLKCSIFVSDMGNYSKINKVYGEYFDNEIAPARELVEVAQLPKNVNIEISVIAALKEETEEETTEKETAEKD